MAEILTAAPAANLICKKDILVKGDDVTIVDKFIKVAHGPDALEDNRARENARENIRKKLALEAERCTEKTDSCDLQICFMNEFASDEDDGSDCRERNGSAEGPALAALEIASSNISKRMSQIIVPIVPHCPAGGSGHSPARPLTPAALFQAEVSRLQAAARVGLERARQPPGQEERLNSVASRVNLNQRLFSLVGLPPTAKLNRRTISRLNVAQLQLIQNDYLAQIKSLNESLVQLLVTKDELVMEQDAMLTDIEDLSDFVMFKN